MPSSSRIDSPGRGAESFWIMRRLTGVLYTVVAVTAVAFMCYSYWVVRPTDFPTPTVTEAPSEVLSITQIDSAAVLSVGQTQNEAHSRELGAARSRRPLEGLSSSQIEQGVVLFPAPSQGFSDQVPFTFYPMRPFSAPPSAMSFIETRAAQSVVELYGVKHSCTKIFVHSGITGGRYGWGIPHGVPPFVQGFMSVGENFLLETSGLYGQSYLREAKLDPEGDSEMKTERVFHLSGDHFAEGVAAYYSQVLERLLLLVLTWQEGVVYLIDYDTFGCLGTLSSRGLEGWGVASSLDLSLYWDFQESQQRKTAAAAAAKAAAEAAESLAADLVAAAEDAAKVAAVASEIHQAAKKRLVEHVEGQQLWITTGGPELLKIEKFSIEEALSRNMDAVAQALLEAEHERQQQQHKPVQHSRADRNCRKELGKLQVRRSTWVHCLGKVLVGLNELEFDHARGTLIANLFGLPALVEINPETGACRSLISLSGVRIVEQYHDTENRVTNGIAIPVNSEFYTESHSAFEDHPGGPQFFITGKQWPYLAMVQLRRLTVRDTLGMESDIPPHGSHCEAEEGHTDIPYLVVETFGELARKLPYFLATRRMKRGQR